MIKTIIIEDEFNTREALKKMLKIVAPDLDIVAETGAVKEATQLIKIHRPHLVFMDIELEDGSSFEILKQLKNTDFSIIFTTAYNQFAIKAFKYSAIDYLLKPIDPTELQESIKKAENTINLKKQNLELLKVLQNNINKAEEKIVLKTTEQRYIINIKDIIRLEADASYTIFITKDKRIIVSKNLKYYQGLLGEQFIRCHQSHLVHKSHIKTTTKNDLVLLSNQDSVPVSSRKKKELFQYLESL